MTELAQRLPVSRIAEQLLIAPVRDNVIDHRGRGWPAAVTSEWVCAQWMLGKKDGSGLAPPGVIAALGGRAPAPVVDLALLTPAIAVCPAAATCSRRSNWHRAY